MLGDHHRGRLKGGDPPTDLSVMDLSKLLGDLYEAEEVEAPADSPSADPSSADPSSADPPVADSSLADSSPADASSAESSSAESSSADLSAADLPMADPPLADPSSMTQVAHTPLGPEWANEARLDEAFAEWRPGPPDDAPAAEREMANGLPSTSFPGLDAALATHDPLPEFDLTEGGMAKTEEAPESAMIQSDVPHPVPTDLDAADTVDPIQPRVWTKADDDVLPRSRGGRKGRRLSLLRR
jgi:hypothetical protein